MMLTLLICSFLAHPNYEQEIDALATECLKYDKGSFEYWYWHEGKKLILKEISKSWRLSKVTEKEMVFITVDDFRAKLIQAGFASLLEKAKIHSSLVLAPPGCEND